MAEKKTGKKAAEFPTGKKKDRRNVPVLMTNNVFAELNAIPELVPFSISVKSKILTKIKEVDVFINAHPQFEMYFRPVLFRIARLLRTIRECGVPKVLNELKELQKQFEFAKAKIHKVIEIHEVKQIEGANDLRSFQIYISNNIRICTLNKITDLQAIMTEAKQFLRVVHEIGKISMVVPFSALTKTELNKTVRWCEDMLAIDGILALQMRYDVRRLKIALDKGIRAEGEVDKILLLMKPKFTKVMKECETKRDEIEKSIREMRYKLMTQVDKEVNTIANSFAVESRHSADFKRNLVDFFVPPTIANVPVEKEFYETTAIGTDASCIPKPTYVYRDAGKGRGDDTERTIE